MPKIVKHTHSSVVDEAVTVLKAGGLIVYPTETCYGIGADATNQRAVNTLLSYKSRREGKPISIAVSDKEMAGKYVEINEIADNLYETHLPGPITVVSYSKSNVADGLESEYKTLGIRLPDYPLIIEIIRKLGNPITATSANMSYKPRPYSIDALRNSTPKKQFEKIDLIIDAGKLPHNEVSTVVDTTLNSMNIIRSGQVAFEAAGEKIASAVTNSPEETAQLGSSLVLKYLDSLRNSSVVFALGGELGSGKTQFAKGVAKQLGIQDTIKSPTFSLVAEYDQIKINSGKLIHIDTWRLNNNKELDALNIDSYLVPGNIIVIEWADKFFSSLKKIIQNPNSIGLKVAFTVISPSKRTLSVEEL